MIGIIPDSFGNLNHLKHFTLTNDGREHEGLPNPHMNTIYLWNNNAIKTLTNLEEINMQHLHMRGVLDASITNLVNLRYLNLAYNKLSGSLPNVNNWMDMQNLKMIELEGNLFTGSLPDHWKFLPNLEYVDVSNNKFTGSIPILQAA